MTIPHKSATVAIVVAYQPELEKIGALLDALLPQVQSVVVVDNGSHSQFAVWLDRYQLQGVHGIFLGVNAGVATAQNVGIEWARRQGAGYVMLFDQDSLPAPDMVKCLTEAIQAKHAEDCAVAAVGPCYVDARQGGAQPFVRLQGLTLKKLACDKLTSIVEVDYLISSGCLIPMSTLDAVGVMRDDLFIDYVDIEWGLRAKKKGFQSYGVCAAKMTHELGEEPIAFLDKTIPVHTPLRHYYQFRNALWMYQQQWLPMKWKLVDSGKLFKQYVFFSIFGKRRSAHFRMMTLGLWHGLRGRMGAWVAPR